MAMNNLGSLFGSPGQATQSIMQLPEVQAYAAQIGQMKTQIGQMAQDELARVLAAPMGSIIPDDNAYMTAVMRRVEEAAVQKKDAVTRQYNSIGRVNSSDHMKALADVDTELMQAKQDTAAIIAKEKITQEIEMRITALSGALGLDTRAAAEIAGLTNLSATEASLQYGISEALIQQLRAAYHLTDLRDQLDSEQSSGMPINSLINNLMANVKIGG